MCFLNTPFDSRPLGQMFCVPLGQMFPFDPLGVGLSTFCGFY